MTRVTEIKARQINKLIRDNYSSVLVTCGACGTIKAKNIHATKCICKHCGMEGDPCDFPDLFY